MQLGQIFQKAQASHKKLFIPFLVAGDPTLESTLEDAIALTQLGADILEIGVPFSDPVADGPIIQQSAARALREKIRLIDCCSLIKRMRDRQCDVPVVLYSYFNPILQLGMDAFIQALVQAKVQAVLIVDLPLEEAMPVATLLKQHNIGLVLLIAPTTSVSRINLTNQIGTAFLYYISRTGVTGSTTALSTELSNNLKNLKHSVDLPVVIGFGFNHEEQITGLRGMDTDGVVVGSALIETRYLEGQRGMLKKAESFIKILHAAH